MNLLNNRWLILIFRLVLGVVLLYSGFNKLNDLAGFARDIQNYDLIPYAFTNVIAILLPWVEVYVGVCLILGFFVDGASILTLLIMGVFVVGVGQAWLRGLNIECGCGLKEGEMVGLGVLLRDIVFFIAAWLVYKRSNRSFELYPPIRSG